MLLPEPESPTPVLSTTISPPESDAFVPDTFVPDTLHCPEHFNVISSPVMFRVLVSVIWFFPLVISILLNVFNLISPPFVVEFKYHNP